MSFSLQNTGNPMNRNFTLVSSRTKPQMPTANFHGNVSHRVGNIRSVTLGGRVVNVEQTIGMEKAVQESIDTAFGRVPLEVQLEADRRSYELKAIF